jgi:hypothetical protein
MQPVPITTKDMISNPVHGEHLLTVDKSCSAQATFDTSIAYGVSM